MQDILKLEYESGIRLAGASLRDIEKARKSVWVRRFLFIADLARRAYDERGETLPILAAASTSASTPEQGAELIRLCVASSAWRTIKGHVGMMQRLIKYVTLHGAAHDMVFPCSGSSIVRFLLYLRETSLKPTVPQAVRASVIWTSKKLMMPTDSIDDNPFIDALATSLSEAKRYVKRDKRVLSVESIKRLETFTAKGATATNTIPHTMAGFYLILVYASLRCDDLIHCAPEVIRLISGAMLGVSWQTKVDRLRVGTKWSATRGSFTGLDWAAVWFDLFTRTFDPRADPPQDHILKAPSEDLTRWLDRPLEYVHAYLAFPKVLAMAGVDPQEIDAVTGVHELRAVFVTLCAHGAAGHTGATHENLMMLGRWQCDKMPKVYTAFAQQIPLTMCRRLTDTIRAGWQPEYEAAQGSTGRGTPVEIVARSMQVTGIHDESDDPAEQAKTDRTLATNALARHNEDPVDAMRPGMDCSDATRTLVNEMSASDASDGEIDDNVHAVELYRYASNVTNNLHIPNELIPTKTACSLRDKKSVFIDAMTAVTFQDGELEKLKPGRFCRACVRARPARFPDSIVAHYHTI
jgi:hypothetical protein